MNTDKLRGRIAEKRLTTEKVAEAIGINPATLYRKLKGTTEFTRDEIAGIAQILEMDNQEILDIFFTAVSA